MVHHFQCMYTFKYYVLQQKIQVKWANVVNTRTNICYTYGCHTRTNHKKNCYHSCISNHGIIYCYIPSSCEAQIQIQKFWRKSMHSCMRTCNQSSWGECWAAKIPHFIHLSYTICHLIPILSFHKTINIHHFHNTYGFILPFSKLFVLSIFKRILD